MMYRHSIPTIVFLLLMFVSCSSQENTEKQTKTPTQDLGPVVEEKNEPHRYGGWYCPDNFGFTPVDIQKLDEVPAIAHRLPTEQELKANMSLINVDTTKYPDARALEMDLPRVARIYSEHKRMHELVIVIQAIIVEQDTVVGYRFMNGGNGSGWLSDMTFLSDKEVAEIGPQPFYYSKSVFNANTEEIWNALRKTDYFSQLGEQFNKRRFFSSDYDPENYTNMNLDTDTVKASGYAGMVYGNFYLQVDYNRNGFHYSEKLLLIENRENKTTEFFFAAGPYPKGFEKAKTNWENWAISIKRVSEMN